MSELKVNAISNAAGTGSITIGSDGSISYPNFGRKNLIINGAMQVAQRGTSFTVGPNGTGEGYTTMDRWRNSLNGSVVSTYSQSADAPNGFGSSAKIEVTTADTSLSSNEFWIFTQNIEGQNVQQIAKGTSDAKAVTVSFWVKSSKTGTYTLELYDGDNSRTASKAYTINSSNTWEYKSLTFNADSTGAFDNDNNASLEVSFWLVAGSQWNSGSFTDGVWATDTSTNRVASGQVNFGDTVGNTIYITGVQLEVGSVATPFEHRSYGEELALCQRYLPAWNGVQPISNAFFFSTTGVGTNITFPVPTRVPPSGIIVSNATHFRFDTVGPYAISSLSFYDAGTKTALITGVVSGAPLNAAGRFLATNSSSQLLFTGCEL